MARSFFAVIVLLFAASAFAQEPVGCDKFKWPLDHERALLANPARMTSGDEVLQPLAAVKVTLVPFADAHLPMAPERALESPTSYAGYVRVSSLPNAGMYRITLSEGAWIDVVQAGQPVKSRAHSGAKGCEGIRKSVKFELTAAPFIIELSGTAAPSIALVVTPD
jgi:hypothetical protein